MGDTRCGLRPVSQGRILVRGKVSLMNRTNYEHGNDQANKKSMTNGGGDLY